MLRSGKSSNSISTNIVDRINQKDNWVSRSGEENGQL